MTDSMPHIGAIVTMAKDELQTIFNALHKAEYTLVGPTIDDEVIIFDEIGQVSDLPIGWTDEQEAGLYRLKKRHDQKVFGFAVGPHSWKKYLFPPRLTIFSVARQNGSFRIQASDASTELPKYAFIGVRACDLAAVHIQDRIFLEGPYEEPNYKARRQPAFIMAINCTDPSGTCFCTSMNTGPKAEAGFDLALTELNDAFLLEIGSEIGRQMLTDTKWQPASAFETQAADEAIAQAEQTMGRQMDTSDLPSLLYDNLEHSRWDALAQRCLSCTNCTQVCPTCFCSDVVDVSDLQGQTADRVRVWDSCFSMEFSHVYGGNSRPDTRSRYRQWLTHKLGSWIDQFGTSGCVGCGRCITWCPVGIDITEEVAAIRGVSGKQEVSS